MIHDREAEEKSPHCTKEIRYSDQSQTLRSNASLNKHHDENDHIRDENDGEETHHPR